MKSYFASYYIYPDAAPIAATILVFDKNLSIGFRNPDGSNVMVSWLLKEVQASFDLSSGQTHLKHNNNPGHHIEIAGIDAANFVKERQTEQQKAWYNKSSGREWIRNSLLFTGLLGLLFLLYLLLVPWVSQQLASGISVKTEKQLGDAVYNAMQLEPREDKTKSLLLNNFFSAMKVISAYDIRITVVNDNTVNAFALPGGHIVVYSALLDQIDSYPELAALLSHEFTHVNNKHSTKSICRRFGSKVFIGLLFGKFGSVTSVLVNNADNLKSLKYSRRLEKEADTEGLSLLLQRKIDPAGFVRLLQHLKEAAPNDQLPEFLGSHPDIGKRVAWIQQNAIGATVKEDAELKGIFDQLKTK